MAVAKNIQSVRGCCQEVFSCRHPPGLGARSLLMPKNPPEDLTGAPSGAPDGKENDDETVCDVDG